MANSAVSTLSAAVVFYVASRYLAPQEFGIVALAVSIVSIASALAPAAFGEALVQRAELSGRHLDTVFWLCFVAAAVLYLPLVLLADPLALWLGEPVLVALLPFLGLRLWFEMLAIVPGAMITRTMRFRLIALRTAIANTAAAAVCLTMLWLGYGFWSLAASQVTAVAVAAAVLLWSVGWRPGFRVSRSAFMDLARYGITMTATRGLATLRLDQLLIGAFGGTFLVGLFNFASRLLQLLNGLIAGALGSVSHALLSSLQADQEKVREAFLMAVFGSAIAAFPIFVGLAAVAPTAIPMIFGAQWEPAVVPVQAFAAIGLITSVGVVQASLMTSQGKTGWWFRYQLASQLANVPVIVVLLPSGLDVTVIGLALKTLALWPATVAMTLRLTGLGLAAYARVFLAPALGAAAMVVAVLGLPMLVAELGRGLGPGALLAAQVLTGALVYTAVAVALSVRRLRRLLGMVRTSRAVAA